VYELVARIVPKPWFTIGSTRARVPFERLIAVGVPVSARKTPPPTTTSLAPSMLIALPVELPYWPNWLSTTMSWSHEPPPLSL
jgi:hypothetical protein